MRTWTSGAAIALTMTATLTMAAGTPGSALADPPPGDRAAGTQTSRDAAASDGLLHVWEHQFGGGGHCTWSWQSVDWDHCGMRNRGSDIWNNGHAGNLDDVHLYWGTWHSGAYVCIGRGTSWNNLSVHHGQGQRITFWAGTGTGAGEPINDNVASHRWANC